jgi:hypothetical protein
MAGVSKSIRQCIPLISFQIFWSLGNCAQPPQPKSSPEEEDSAEVEATPDTPKPTTAPSTREDSADAKPEEPKPSGGPKEAAGVKPELTLTPVPPTPTATPITTQMVKFTIVRVSKDTDKKVCLQVATGTGTSLENLSAYQQSICNEGDPATKELMLSVNMSQKTNVGLKFTIEKSGMDPVVFVPTNTEFVRITKNPQATPPHVSFDMEDDTSANSNKDMNDFKFRINFETFPTQLRWPGDP